MSSSYIEAEPITDAGFTWTLWKGEGGAIGFKVERVDGKTEYAYLSPGRDGCNDPGFITEDPTVSFYVGPTGDIDKDSSVPFNMFLEGRKKYSNDPLDPEITCSYKNASNQASADKPNTAPYGSQAPSLWAARYEDDVVYIRFPYDEHFLEELKSQVPPQHRWWDKYHKEWRLNKSYWPVVENLLIRHFG